MKGCSKFAHLCKDHDQNKPANEKFDDQMEIIQIKKKQKEQLEEQKQAELKQLEEEKQEERLLVCKPVPEFTLTKEFIEEKPDDYNYNEESEMSDYESDDDSEDDSGDDELERSAPLPFFLADVD